MSRPVSPDSAHGVKVMSERVNTCLGCGRVIPDGETPKEWAAREIEHHGPPPQSLVDLVRRIAKKNDTLNSAVTRQR